MQSIRTVLLAGAAVCALAMPAQANVGSSYNGWSGLYIGGNVGAGWGSFTNNVPTNIGPNDTGGGFTGGAQIGADFQVLHQLVFGLVADFNVIDITAENAGNKFEEEYMMTFRGRAGIPVGNWLPYLTAGIAGTHVEATVGANSQDDTIWDFTGGAGVDYAIDNHWSVRTEYLYVDVQKETTNVGGSIVEGGSGNSILRFAFNYRL